MPRALLGLLLLLPTLAGCLDGSRTPTPDLPVDGGKTPVALPLKMKYGGCSEPLGVFPTTPDVVAPYLPPGFAPAPFDPAGATALIVLIAYTCATLEAPNATTGAVREMKGIIPVVAPAKYADVNATHHAVLLGVMTTSDAARTVYRGWNVTPARDGTVTIDAQTTPLARVGTAVADGSEYSGAMQTVVRGPNVAQAAGSARLFQVANDTVMGAYDLAWTASDGMEGVAALREPADFPGVPATIAPGLGFHYWADTYAYTMTRVALPTA